MTQPLTGQQPDPLAEIRARFEATTHPNWRDTTDVGVLLAAVDRLTAELAASDDEVTAVMLHNDATCEAVAERDRLRREVGLYIETLHRRDATIAQFRAALATDHHVAYHQGEPRDGLLYHCGRDHCPAPAARPSA